MKFQPLGHDKFLRIISGEYTSTDLREFLQLCYALALPFIRFQITTGRLDLHRLGLTETDVVQDSLADLFSQNHIRQFGQITQWFEKLHPDLEAATDEELVLTLRRLVIGKLNKEIVRMLGEADPTLADILRNLKLSLKKSDLFYQATFFTDKCLLTRDADPLLHQPPMAEEFLEQEFLRTARTRDNVPQLLQKLHAVLVMQDQYQRVVHVVAAALLFKRIQTARFLTMESSTETVEEEMVKSNLHDAIDTAISRLSKRMHQSYIESGKCTEEIFQCYMSTIRDIFFDHVGLTEGDGTSFFEGLRTYMPGLTKEMYRSQHKAVLEYLVSLMKDELKSM